MSFDTIFDYTGRISQLNGKIMEANAIISNIDAQISDLGSVTGSLSDMANTEVIALNTRRNILVSQRDLFQEVKAEINGVVNLSSQDKTTLYDFYGNVEGNIEPTTKWMSRMMYNSQSLTPHAANINRSVLTSPQRASLSSQLCRMYPINNNIKKSRKNVR